MIAKRLLAIQKASSPPAPAATDVYYDYRSLILNMQGSAGSTTFTDSSPNNFTVTPYGNAQLATVPGESVAFLTAASFDGTTGTRTGINSTLLDFGAGDFTAECWVYLRANPPAWGQIMGKQVYGTSASWILYVNSSKNLAFAWNNAVSTMASSSSLNLNQWYHVAACRIGSTIRLFIDGVQVATSAISYTFSSTTEFTIASASNDNVNSRINALIGPLRISPWAVYKSNFTPSANLFPAAPDSIYANPYYDKVALSLKFDGTNGSTSFVDTGPNAFAVTPSGNAQITSASKYGSGAGAFDGSGDRLTVANNAAFNFGAGDFTVEAWINKPSNSGVEIIYTQRNNGPDYAPVFLFVYNGVLTCSLSSTGTSWMTGANLEFNAGIQIPTNAWTHVAVTRNGSTFRLFQDGVLKSTYTSSSALFNSTRPVSIGAYAADVAYSNYFTGSIDELEITPGVAKYKANFTPPVRGLSTIYNPYTTLPVSGAALWLDGADSSTLFTDAGVTPVTKSGDLIYQWSDKSSNNRHATQATSANRPTWVPPASGQNGFGGMRVQTNRRLSLSTTYTLTSDFTCFVVMKNASSLIVWLDSNSSTSVNSVAKTPLYYSGWGGGGGWTSSLKSGSQPTLNSASPFSGPSMLMFSRAGTSGTFSIDSVIYSATYSTSEVEIDHAVGGIQNNISTDFSVFEQIVYPSALNTAEINSVKSYLRTKWGTP